MRFEPVDHDLVSELVSGVTKNGSTIQEIESGFCEFFPNNAPVVLRKPRWKTILKKTSWKTIWKRAILTFSEVKGREILNLRKR
ncbi:hypothetical protein LIER_40518 [Lithospermum erythrorhizon]|uniref:Uncharacterized protein n=1 Tax=Lithospermum erythrorhizon TaxID=34254 RepID=A0AAV3QYC2_LITER